MNRIPHNEYVTEEQIASRNSDAEALRRFYRREGRHPWLWFIGAFIVTAVLSVLTVLFLARY